VGDLLIPLRKQFFPCVADHVAALLVDAQPSAVDGNVRNAHRCLLERRSEPLFVLPEGSLCLHLPLVHQTLRGEHLREAAEEGQVLVKQFFGNDRHSSQGIQVVGLVEAKLPRLENEPLLIRWLREELPREYVPEVFTLTMIGVAVSTRPIGHR